MTTSPSPAGALRDAPPAVAELANACVRFVERAVGVAPDFTPETLPLVDHWIASSRDELRARPDAAALVVRAAAAYFGEVVRARVASFWHTPADDPDEWEIRLEPVWLSFNPAAFVADAILRGDEAGGLAGIELDDAEREGVEEKLAELPAVSEDEFYALSTRLEVIEIAVDAIKNKMAAEGLGDVAFGPGDYPA